MDTCNKYWNLYDNNITKKAQKSSHTALNLFSRNVQMTWLNIFCVYHILFDDLHSALLVKIFINSFRRVNSSSMPSPLSAWLALWLETCERDGKFNYLLKFLSTITELLHTPLDIQYKTTHTLWQSGNAESHSEPLGISRRTK